jgi:magnesium transporter
MPPAVNWIDLLDPSVEELERHLPATIHERALARLRAPAEHDDEPRPRFESHGDYVYGVFIVPVCRRRSDEVHYQEIDLIVTHEVVLTIRKTPAEDKPFNEAPIRERVEAEPGASAGKVVYFLIDAIAEEFLHVVDELDDEIDEIEEGVESWEADVIRARVSYLRRHFLHIRRALGPTRDAVDRVADRRIDVTGDEVFPQEIEYDFRDAYDKLLRAMDGLEFTRDLLNGVRDYHQAKVSNDQNEVVKRLTVIASLLLVPTFIVGVYGQNFDVMPELHWYLGYVWSWGWIVLLTLAQLAFFRWKRWI